jgi:hypothetical protein
MIDADGNFLAGNGLPFDEMAFQNLAGDIERHGVLLAERLCL